MFTYINPDIRERLIRDGKLFRIDADGCEVQMTDAPGPGLHLNLMGPIPFHCPLHAVFSNPLFSGTPA